jgi:hypothetical protein
MPKLRLVAISDRPFSCGITDTTGVCRHRCRRARTYYSGLNGLLAVLALIGLATCIGTMS